MKKVNLDFDNVPPSRADEFRNKFEEDVRLEKDRIINTTKDAPEKHIAHNFFIAGVQFHELHKVIKSLEIGNNFELVPEPTNKFDPNAVRLEYNTSNETIMCGYIPKKFSAEVAAMISIGKCLECKIIELNPEKKPWEQCKVTIEEVK